MKRDTKYFQTIQDRKLFDLIPCDTTLLTIKREDIAAGFSDLLDLISPPGFIPGDTFTPINVVVEQMFTNQINYGVVVKKMCASCKEVLSAEPEFLTRYNNAAFEQYCGEDVYGFDTQHSGLVTYPLEEGSTIRSGALPGYVYSRSSKVAINDIPSEFGKNNVDVALGVLASVAQGLPSISPDFMGYGSSDVVRGYLIKDSYVTSTLPLWLKLKLHLREETNCNTDLDSFAFYTGYSEGGYASVALADGFKEAMAVQPSMVLSGGGPYGTKDNLLFDLVRGSVNPNPSDSYFSALLGAAYSSTHPGIKNFNKGQNLLSDEFRDIAVGWLEEKNITFQELIERMSSWTADTTVNPDVLQLVRGAFESGDKMYCQPGYSGYKVGVHDKICEALIQNDLTEILYNVDYPVLFCHSLRDEIVSFDHVPNMISPYFFLRTKNSTHRVAGFECFFDALNFLADGISAVMPGFESNVEVCKTQGPTPGPTPSEPSDDTLFLYKKKKGDIRKTKTCRWLVQQSFEDREKLCTAKKYQIWVHKPERFGPASVACPGQCMGWCMKEYRSSLFLFKTKKKKTVERPKSCKWLQKQTPSKITDICSKTVEFSGSGSSIYGQASSVCTTTCETCSP
eukprot:jgi/Psemu1/317328/estExt_fgenesh1_pm.C_60016